MRRRVARASRTRRSARGRCPPSRRARGRGRASRSRPRRSPGRRARPGSARARPAARRSGAPPRGAARRRASGSAAALVMWRWFGCIHSSQPGRLDDRAGQPVVVRVGVGADQQAHVLEPQPGLIEGVARAGASRPARTGRCPPAPRRCRPRSRTRSRAAPPARAAGAAAARARAARGRRAPARAAASRRSCRRTRWPWVGHHPSEPCPPRRSSDPPDLDERAAPRRARRRRAACASSGWAIAARPLPRAARSSWPRPCSGARTGSTSTPGLRIPAGSSAALAARSASANGSGRWRSYQGRWSRPTAWWWVIVPPAADDRLGRRGLDLRPLLELRAAARRGEHREVGRRAVGVGVREPAGDACPSPSAAARPRAHLGHERRRSGPR